MATLGETSYQGNGGVGGKFRVNSNRRDSKKPYSRPSVANRNTSAEKQTSWRPRIVESASRIVTESAHKLFSSVFRKNLQAIPMNSEANNKLGDAFPEEVPYEDSEDQEHVNDGRDGLNNNSSGDVLNDLEQILKQKTFTKVELDRLTELLRSRTSDVSAVNEQKRFETSASQLVDAGRKGSGPVLEKEVKIQTSLGPPSTSSGSFVDEDIASPTEIAKAYMGSRSSKLTPLTLGYQNQPFREDVSLQNGVLNTPKPHIMSPVPRTSVRYASLPNGSEKDYLTPAPRGRYALYSMTRTPYSRVHHSAILRTEGKAGPSISSQRSSGKNLFSGGRQAFKRRSTELDSELGSIGPIRRIRRKTEMTSPSASPSIPFVPIGSAASKRGIKENAENSIASKRFACVPNQSRDTAQKILEQLEKLAPSPKGKSCELKAIGVTKTPSPKLMPGDNHYSSPRVDEIIPTGTSILKDDLGPKANGIITTLEKETTSSVKKTNALVSCSAENDSQRKQPCEENGFQKTQPCGDNANKDSHKLEENNFSRQIESNPSVAGKVKHDRPAVENKENPSGAMTVGEPVAPDISNPRSFMLKKTCGVDTSVNLTASEKGRGGTYPDKNATATVVEPAPSTSPSLSSFNVTSSSSEPIPFNFSFPAKTLVKTTSESSDLNGAKSEAKPKTMSSTPTPSNEVSDKASNGGTAPVIFSFGGASTSSTLSNGTTTPFITATPTPPLFQFGSTTSSTPPIFQFGSTTSTTSTAPSNGPFVFGSQPAPSPIPTSPVTDKMDVEDNATKTQAPTLLSNNFAFPATIQTQTQAQSPGFGLSAGGSFSVGSGGGGGGDDKSTRRIIKINRSKLRKR